MQLFQSLKEKLRVARLKEKLRQASLRARNALKKRKRTKKRDIETQLMGPLIDQGVMIQRLEDDDKVIESYAIHDPLAQIKIARSPRLGPGYHYFVDEALLTNTERRAYEKLVSILSKELEPPEDWEIDTKTYIMKETMRIAGKYKRSLGRFNEDSWIIYRKG